MIREDPKLRRGVVDDAVQRELRGLRLLFTVLEARVASRSPVSLRHQLRDLSDGTRGGGAVAMRTHAIPQAYRSLFRQIGLDPDVNRPPREQAAVNRLLEGRYRSSGLPQDALLLALLETGIGIWALDAAAVEEASFGVRACRDGEEFLLDGGVRELAAGRLVVADAGAVHALLFGDPVAGSRVSRQTERMLLYAVGAEGVPEIHLHEVIWTAAELLAP